MSKARACKVAAVPNGDNGSSTRPSVMKAADDTLTQTVRPEHENRRSRSRNKIPKSVRYDLENSLVGLCDIWFEEIKPHLVRNNIKLHVHDGATAGCASGDYEQHQLPVAGHNCSHTDPGAAPDLPRHMTASCADSCSMQPTVLKAPCRKQQAHIHRRHHRHPPSPTLNRECAQNQRHICEDRRILRPYTVAAYIRRKKRTAHQPGTKVPRLCRSVIPSAVKQSGPQLPIDDRCGLELFQTVSNEGRFVFPNYRWKSTTKNRSTQTKPPVSTEQAVSADLKSGLAGALQFPSSHPFNRRGVTTSLKSKQDNNMISPSTKEPALFQNDLIDIIAEKKDTRLKVIYNSLAEVEFPSIMNLVSPNAHRRSSRAGGPKKNAPWR